MLFSISLQFGKWEETKAVSNVNEIERLLNTARSSNVSAITIWHPVPHITDFEEIPWGALDADLGGAMHGVLPKVKLVFGNFEDIKTSFKEGRMELPKPYLPRMQALTSDRMPLMSQRPEL